MRQLTLKALVASALVLAAAGWAVPAQAQDYPNKPIQPMHVHAFQPDDSPDTGRLFAQRQGSEPGVPDGMKVDLQGHVYCCGPGGIHVLQPDGRCVARIRLPEKACNFAFGDADHCTMYVTACTSVYRLRLLVPGKPQWAGLAA